MRSPFAVAFVVLSACNPTSDAPVSRQQQSLPAVARVLPPPLRTIEGTVQEAHLGASLSACDGLGGFIAGAPGVPGIYAEPLNATVRLGSANVLATGTGSVVLCERTQALALAGGPSGLWRAMLDGGSELLREGSVRSLISNPGDPILAGVALKDGGAQLWRVPRPEQPSGVEVTVLRRSPSAGFAASLAYFPFGQRFLIGDEVEGEVYVYKHLDDGGVSQTQRFDGGMNQGATGKYGLAVLVGDVLPDPGLEIIVAAPAANEVIIYAVNGSSVRLEPSSTLSQENAVDFGSALALEPGNAGGGLSALWIGEPGTARVYRCFGLACDVYENIEMRGTRFGAALAFDRGTLVVGAPDYVGATGLQQQGGVFVYAADAGTLPGEAQHCQLDAGCRLGCTPGLCIGGVLCLPNARMDCRADEQCIENECKQVDAGTPDAGVPDAGEVDAGGSEPLDAGQLDAGDVDGGEDVDAGDGQPVVFQTGCASAPVAMTVLLLTLLRRRRTGVQG